ncbi:MAG: PASTA domain-containing protein [Clostridia bacterium]|nr:PASTA domain-containing protein [Clostridia bacterium]
MVSKSEFIKRLSVLSILITFLFTAVVGKLFYVQIVEGKDLQAKALDQWTRDIPYVAERGKIVDRNGVVLAATSTTYTCYVRPTNLKNAEQTARAIAEATAIDYEKILEKISKKGASEITVAKKMTKEQVNYVLNSGATGVYFSKDVSRYYPYGDLASQVIGFTNIDASGQSGLELYYDNLLKGVNGSALTETDIVGRELNEAIYYLPAIDGAQITTTLDKSIQYFAESAVEAAVNAHQAKSASCIVMDITSGGVAAMAQYPSIDLNNIDRSNLDELFAESKLCSVCNVYETGSVFKIITMAAAIEEGLVSENETFQCGGSRTIDGQKIKCWKTKGHGLQTFAEGVMNSCNCVFMDLALRLGKEKLYSYYEKFNLTEKTGLDFAGESKGLLIPIENVKTVDLARMGFGQAIAVTPIELASAVSAIVGGGIYKKAHILSAAYDPSGREVYSNQEESRRVVSEQTSSLVRKLLFGVVDGGSGKLAGVDGYHVGGKTGTAQKYLNGSINRGHYLSSFIGFTTVEDPKYVVYFYVDEPEGIYYGSQVAAPYVGEIFSKILSYEKVEKAEVEERTPFIMPDFYGWDYFDVKKKAEELGIYLEAEGEGDVVIEQFPPANASCDEKCVLFIKTEEAKNN